MTGTNQGFVLLDAIQIYFHGEKIEALVFILPIGLLSLVFGLWLLTDNPTNFTKGVAIPFLLMGLLMTTVGGVVGYRTPSQVSGVVKAIEADPRAGVQAEIQRMTKVNSAWHLYLVMAILLFYRIPAKNLGHDIGKTLKLAEKLPFDIEFTAGPKKLVNHIATYGPYRYLEAPWFLVGHSLPMFDMAIWQLRRYCQPIDHAALQPDGSDRRITLSIEQSKKAPAAHFKILGGLLEEIIDRRGHSARPALIWQNLCFGPRAREGVQSMYKMTAENPPLMLHPEILDDLETLVHIPRDVARATRELWAPEKVKREMARQNRSVP